MPSLYIIDASGYLYRSYFAIRNMTNPKGQSTNALFGFIRSVQKLIKDFSAEHVVAIFDGPNNKVAREAIYSDYKAHRSATPQDLLYQLEWARLWCDIAGISSMSLQGVEADDTMGSLALYAKERGYTSYLCTSDKDLCQMVGPDIFILNTFKENLILGPKEVEEQFGVRPDQIIDYLSMLGDASDNVPGLPGIGPKGAIKLLQECGTLEEILAHPEKISSKAARKTIEENKELAILSKKLVTLIPNIPIPTEPTFFHLKKGNKASLTEFYQEMNFVTLLKDLNQEPTLQGDVVEEKKVHYELVNDEAALKHLLKRLESETEIAFDTETTSEFPLKAELVGVSFAVNEAEAWYIPMNGGLPPHKLLGILKPLFENSSKKFYGHNIKYDLHLLRNYGIEIKNISFDTIIASYILNAHERRHNLDYLTLTCFNKVKTPIQDLIGKGKSQITMREVPLDKISHYACEDVDYTVRLKNKFEKELKERGLEKVFYELELPLVRVLAEMEREGIYLDIPLLKVLQDKVVEEIKVLQTSIIELAGEEFNLNSPKQLSTILFEKMGIKPPRKTDTGYSTDADVLEQLKWEHPIAEKLLEYRSLEKLRSTYIEKLPGEVSARDGRIHCNFNQTVAATGRLSCQDPNLQNIPIRTSLGREIREAFRPEKKGWSYFAADYSQIELRLLAHLSEDESLIKAFLNNEDIHTRTAADVMGVPLEEVTKEMRRQAKAVNFGILYGQGEYGLSQELGITRAAAGAFIARYFEKYPQIKNFIQKCKDETRKTGRSVTLTGRERLIPEINSKNGPIRQAAERLAVNTPLQGTAADLIKLAMLQLDKKLKERQSRGSLILQIHDELVFEIPDEEIDLYKELVPRYMQSVFNLKVPLITDVKVGKNWKEC